jgi:hypothetical protein
MIKLSDYYINKYKDSNELINQAFISNLIVLIDQINTFNEKLTVNNNTSINSALLVPSGMFFFFFYSLGLCNPFGLCVSLIRQ